MTLSDIIVAALQQTRRGSDQQTIHNFEDRFTQYANEAQQDLAKDFPVYRTDEITVEEPLLDVNALPRWCTKLMAIWQKGRRVRFDADEATGLIRLNTSGDIRVTYRYLPKAMESLTDVPEIPEHLHQCIVTWVVGRDFSEGDPTTQGGASMHFQIYNDTKRRLMRGGMGTPGSYKIRNMERW